MYHTYAFVYIYIIHICIYTHIYTYILCIYIYRYIHVLVLWVRMTNTWLLEARASNVVDFDQIEKMPGTPHFGSILYLSLL